jgi:tetratricopeptide (TPR) repeat protein
LHASYRFSCLRCDLTSSNSTSIWRLFPSQLNYISPFYLHVANPIILSKTQIAIEYCYLFKERSPEASVFWIHGTTDRFTQAYREIATRLNVPGHDSIERDTIKLVTDWLSDERSGQWLMVLDNADDSSLFFPNRSASIRNDRDVKLLAHYLPRVSTGNILVTTRDSKLGERLCNREKPISVYTMQMYEAEALLRSKIADELSSEDGSKELLDELAFLPLAITQAAAFISENQISVRGYLEILRMGDRDMQELLSEDLEDPRRDLETDNSVIRTWKISFDRILMEDPRAADMLSLMAVLERSGVPIFLLRQNDETETSFTKALGTLQAFSLISGDRGKSPSFRMHRLVQFATQRWLDIRGKLSEWQAKAVAAVAKFYPVDTGLDTWPICEVLAPHAQLVLSYKCDACSSQEARRQRGILLSKKCVYEYDMGRFQNAYIEGKEGFDILTELCAEDDPDVLRCYNNMGVWLSSQGQLNESKAFLEKAVAGNEKVLGIDHSETWKSLLNLSMILQRLEEYEEAEKLIQKVIERQSKLLGPDAAPTLITQQWIAAVWKAKGDLEASEKLYRRIRQGLEITCGPEDPAILDCLKELAVVLKLEGKLEEAISLLRVVVAAWEKQSGPTAALTLGGIVLLADCISAMGDHVAAEKVIRDALVRETTLSGEESPTNIMLLNQIGVLQNKQCHHEQAEETFLKVIAQEEKFFGKENSNTMISTMSLAYAIEKIALEMNRPERYMEVERLYRYVLEICERTRGLRSDEAIDCRKRLHTLLKNQGKDEEAAAVMKGFE